MVAVYLIEIKRIDMLNSVVEVMLILLKGQYPNIEILCREMSL